MHACCIIAGALIDTRNFVLHSNNVVLVCKDDVVVVVRENCLCCGVLVVGACVGELGVTWTTVLSR